MNPRHRGHQAVWGQLVAWFYAACSIYLIRPVVYPYYRYYHHWHSHRLDGWTGVFALVLITVRALWALRRLLLEGALNAAAACLRAARSIGREVRRRARQYRTIVYRPRAACRGPSFYLRVADWSTVWRVLGQRGTRKFSRHVDT